MSSDAKAVGLPLMSRQHEAMPERENDKIIKNNKNPLCSQSTLVASDGLEPTDAAGLTNMTK